MFILKVVRFDRGFDESEEGGRGAKPNSEIGDEVRGSQEMLTQIVYYVNSYYLIVLGSNRMSSTFECFVHWQRMRFGIGCGSNANDRT